MRITPRLAGSLGALTLAVTVAACSGSSSSPGTIGGGTSTAGPHGAAQHGGTATIALVGAAPNFLFPYPPATNQDGWNVNLEYGLWPPLVYQGDGGQSKINSQESLFSSITYGDGNKQVTIVLKPWVWSDGTPITSRDFTFAYNLLKANVPNWNLYTPGLFPTDVAKVSTPNSHTVVLDLTRSYNPTFYTEDVLSTVELLPQHAWDKTSLTGPVKNYDQTAAGAKAVYAFLQKEGGQMSTFTTNPLWKVVYGPWELSGFQSNGYWSYVPNKRYSGPDKPRLSKVAWTPFTTDTAELNALRSGSALDVGQLPLNDLNQVAALKAGGYSVASQPIPGVAEIVPNFYNASVGPLLRQLYLRQAMEYLINRPQIVSKVYGGYADPGNGPVPLQAGGPWVSPLEKSGGPYPFSPSKAIDLLKEHGWKVVPGGTSTCQHAGTGAADCGAGITAGEPLSFQFVWSSGQTSMDEQNAAIQSSEEQAGIKFNAKSEPFNTLISTVGTCTAAKHPASTCGWQLVDFGYDPYLGLYPSGAGFFNTGGYNNSGGYSNTEMNNLVNATEFGNSAQTFYTYENYAAQQLPWLWLPNNSIIQVYKSNLQGFAPLNPFSGGLNPESWYFTK
jgi:peptide/nickel transport system substrate-binding protein